MWRLGQHLVGQCVYVDQDISFIGVIAAKVSSIYIGGKKVGLLWSFCWINTVNRVIRLPQDMSRLPQSRYTARCRPTQLFSFKYVVNSGNSQATANATTRRSYIPSSRLYTENGATPERITLLPSSSYPASSIINPKSITLQVLSVETNNPVGTRISSK